jgi:hypothetical protein
MSWQPILNRNDAKKGIWKPVLKVSEANKRSQFGNVRPSNPLFERLGENVAESAVFQTGTPSTPRTTNFGTGDLAKAFGQGVMQGFGATGAALRGVPEQARAYATDTPVRPGSQSFTPTGAFQKGLYGTDKPITLETGGEIQGFSDKGAPFKPYGVEMPGVSNAMAVGAGFGVLDLSGAGGLRGLKGLTNALRVTEDVAESVSLLKKAGFAEDIAQQYAPLFAKEKNAKKIEQGLLSAEKLQNSTKVAAPQAFEGFTDLSTKLLEKLKGRTTVSKQFILDATNQADLKQPEKDLFRRLLADESDTVSVPDFANKVKSELLPLKIRPSEGVRGMEPTAEARGSRYENITLPDELRGPVANYNERIYESPIKTSAGQTHFGGESDNYFAHTRIEDLPDNKTRRVIEAQSDLFQKGGLEGEAGQFGVLKGDESRLSIGEAELAKRMKVRDAEVAKLEPYRNTWHERVIREEVKQAAIDGKTKLQFPTGETAMKIEGLGDTNVWFRGDGYLRDLIDDKYVAVGKQITRGGTIPGQAGESWIITDVLGDGKFKAVPKAVAKLVDDLKSGVAKAPPGSDLNRMTPDEYLARQSEQFDISGKVDTNNPIYKFYEKEVGKYLKNKYNAQLVTDAQGVKWWEVPVTKATANTPVEAYGVGAGIQTDEEGNVTFSPESAALGVLGVAGMSKVKGAGKTLTKEALSKLPPSTSAFRESIPQTAKVLKEALSTVLEYVQNTEERVRKLVGQKGLDVSVDPYETMTLYHGRVGDKIEQGYNAVQDITDDVIDLVGRSRTDVDTGRAGISKYLQALHAPERNAALGEGAAGMTTAEARQIVAEASPGVKAIAQKALTLHKKTLDLLHDSGVITDELYATLREKYQNHVPLQRVFEGDDMGDALSGRGFDVRSTGIKTAKGSEREVADVLTNIVNNYEQAVIRSEKNIVDNATLAFVRNNEADLKGLIEIKHPRAIGKRLGAEDGPLLLEQTNDPKIMQMFENGKRTWIEFKDERLATAFRGVGREKLGAFMQGVGAFTRFYAGLMTRFNYEFALPNKIRDLQETITYMASQKDVGFKGAASVLTKDVSSIRDIAFSLAKPDSPYAKMYQEMKSLGGTTGGLGLSTRKQTELNIDKIFATARSRPRQAASKLIEYVDNWNTIFEDSTRLSVYKAALDRGVTKERAAFLAKEASINFNRMGKGGPLINALYMFANASIQGSVKMLRAMKDPKVAAGVFSVVGASVAAVGEWNDTVDPEWRDKVTEWDRDGGLPIMLPTSDGSTAYFTIPVSWGIKPILVMSNAMYDAVSGKEVDTAHATGKIFSSFIDAYNPVGGSDIVSSLTPTAIDVPTEISRNESWSGAKIRPDFNRNLPRDLQYFDSLKDTVQGRTSIAITDQLRESTGYLVSPADLNYVIDQYIGGAGRSVKKINETLYGLVSGEMPPADEWPMVSRFLRLRTEEETGQGAGGAIDKIRSALSEQEREKFEIKNEAVDTFEELSALPKDVAAERFNMLNETNPEIAKKVVEIANDKKLGLNYTERLIKQLNVQNGERAAYIAGYLKTLGSKEEKAKAWQNFVSKKILTTEVSKQVTKLLEE